MPPPFLARTPSAARRGRSARRSGGGPAHGPPQGGPPEVMKTC